jgi:hypothetical protein
LAAALWSNQEPLVNVTLDLAALIAALVWPVVVVFALSKYRQPITDLSNAALQRGFNVGLGGFSLEIPGVHELMPRWSGKDMEIDLRRPIPSAEVTDSTAQAFITQLEEGGPADYAALDLGEGREWLSSRLFIMSILLRRMRNLQVFVFVKAAAGVQRRLIGVAELEKVRWAIAQRDFYLEEAFAHAYSRLFSKFGAFDVVSRNGRLESRGPPPGNPWPAVLLLQFFLANIQAQARPAGEDEQEWVPLTPIGPATAAPAPSFEHAQWLDGAGLEKLLGRDVLNTSRLSSSDLYGRDELEEVRLVLAQPGPYIAVTDADGRFERLIERQAVMEQFSRAALRS